MNLSSLKYIKNYLTKLIYNCILYFVRPPVQHLPLTSLYLAFSSHWRRLKSSKRPFVLKMYVIVIIPIHPPMATLPPHHLTHLTSLCKLYLFPTSTPIKICQVFKLRSPTIKLNRLQQVYLYLLYLRNLTSSAKYEH